MVGFFVGVLLLTAAAAPSIKLASPGISSVNVTPELQSFVTDHLNQELVIAGVSVLSSSQVAAVLSLERQRQLMGCNASSECVAEFASALGVDGLLLGNLARFGSTIQLDVRVAAATDAHNLATVSIRIPDDSGLLEGISSAATAIAHQLSATMKISLTPLAQPAAPITLTATRYTLFRTVGMWSFLVSSAALAVGVVMIFAASPQAPPPPAIQSPDPPAFLAGLGLFAGGLLGMAIGGTIWIFGGNEPVPLKASLVPSREGFTFALSGSF